MEIELFEVFGQYMIVILAFACIIGLKFYVINKRVSLQSEQFIDPEQCIDKIGKEVKSSDPVAVL